MIDTLMAIAGAVILYIQNSFMFGITLIIAILYAIIVFAFNRPLKEINRKQMEEIIEVCKKAKAHDFINELPLRYEMMLEENGNNLSGGQKQRLAIARALLQKPAIMIMDEATSSLDSITEKAIERTINESTQNITTIIIAHRLSTIMKCDEIYVIDKGKFIESGTHKELMKKRGEYKH